MSKRVPAILLSAIALLVNGMDSAIAQTYSQDRSSRVPLTERQSFFDTNIVSLTTLESPQVKQNESRADQIYEQGRQAYGDNNLREALRFYQQALNLYEQSNDFVKQSLVLSNMSFAVYNLSEPRQALDYAVHALSAAEKGQDPNMESLALYSLGIAYEVLDKDLEAIEAFSRSLEIAREISHTRRVSLVSRALGDVYTESSRYSEAIAQYQISSDAANQINDRRLEGRSLYSLGILHKLRGDTSTGYDLYQDALSIAFEIDDQVMQSTVLYAMAALLMENGYKEEAIGYAIRSKTISEEIQDWASYSSAATLLEYLYGSPNNRDQTIQDIRRILNNSKENGNVSSTLWALMELGNQHTELDAYDQAFLFYEEGFVLAETSKNTRAVSEIFSSLGSLMERKGDQSSAITFYKKSVNIIQSTRQGIRNLSPEIQQTYISLNSFVYRQLIDLLLEQGRVLEAQQVLELLKVQELREYTDDERTGETLSQLTLLPKEQNILTEFDTLVNFGQQLRKCETDRCSNLSDLYNIRDELFQQYQEAVDSLQTFISDRLEEGDDPKLILEPTDFETKAQEIIDQQPGTVVAYPLVLEDRLWLLWAADGRIISSREISVDRLTVGKTVIEFRELLENRYSDPDDIKTVGKQLYDWLIFPIEEELAANQEIKHLVFSLDRTTRYIPLGALYNGEQYLVEKYTISTILSAALTDVSNRSPVGTEGVSILGAGVSQRFEDFRALSYVPIELDGIIREEGNPSDTQGFYSGRQLLDPDFTFEALRGALAGRQFLHIATHGNFVAGDRDESYLLMGDGKKLLIPEIETLKTYMKDLHMVVLSACQTALGGPDEEGLEIAGLGYYFLKSQVDAVMASLWNVSDSSTSQFMQTFYEILASGTEERPITKAEALQRTQIAMLLSQEPGTASDERFTYVPQDDDAPLPESGLAHPYYWAPFTLIGNGL